KEREGRRRRRGPAPSPFFLPTDLLPATLSPILLLSRYRSLAEPRNLLLFLATISSPHQPSTAQPLPLSPLASPLSLSSAVALTGLCCQPSASLLSSHLPHVSHRHPCCRPSLPVARSSAAPHGVAFLPCFLATVAGQPLAVHCEQSLDPRRYLLYRNFTAHSNVVAAASQPRYCCCLLATLSRCRCPLPSYSASRSITAPFALLTLPACRSSAAVAAHSSAAQPPQPSLLPHLPPSLFPCFLLPLLAAAAFLLNRNLTCHVVASLSPVAALTIANHLCPPLVDADNLVVVKSYYIYDICP
ncbi:hypothetical protein GW17_00058229, partial [Ensete ventricosum]